MNNGIIHIIDFSGIAYGGTYGLVMAMVLEAVPRRARGVVAGFTQQGFSAGYLFASGFHLAMSESCIVDLFFMIVTDSGR